MSNPRRIHVLGIDWQVDFCDPKGALFVAGADVDTGRMAKFINRIGPRVEMFHFTLDSHQAVHIRAGICNMSAPSRPTGVTR